MQISSDHPVAYFCAEFGLDTSLPLYAGGLGVLAGDTVKEAADQHFPMVALGLLYRGCDAVSYVDESGMQFEHDIDIDPVAAGFEHVYIPEEDQPLFVRIHLTEEDVWARVWKKTVNQATIYLLDTDTDQNEPEERGIACAIYSGGDDFLLKQQMILGIGGVKVLDALGIEPVLYHVNEGRPAFLYWQLIRRLMDSRGMTYEEAAAAARGQIVYTNHTLVRAGNNAYERQLLENYALYYAQKMGVSIKELLEPGVDPSTDAFSMTQFALNTSRKSSAVSQLHYDLSKNLWPEYSWVGITNGVHMPTWQDPEIVAAETREAIWQAHQRNKQELVDFCKERTGYGYDPNRLVVGWARRIATYKRPLALFEDIERLMKILSREGREVQIVMSGKAHAKDGPAKKMLQQVIQHMQTDLNGYALYIPNYDLDVAARMVRGADVWLNTPILGKEASGTSGMKAMANGVLQLTVEDGFAAEVDWHGVGWTLDSNHIAPTIYLRLEDDIVPLFYDRDPEGVPQGWVKRMKQSIEKSQQFSTTRMLKEYQEKLYRA